jgi:hypothetical protein
MASAGNENGSIKDHGPWLFRETISPSAWWIFALVLPAMSWLVFTKVHWKGISLKHLAWLNLWMSVIAIIPSVAYVVSGTAWTGMTLSSMHRTMINSRHVVSMGTWSVLSIIQMIAYLGGKQSLHNSLGKFLMYIWLPLIFVELSTNAIVVYWPEKPLLLFQSIQGATTTEDEPTITLNLWDSIIYTTPAFYAFSTPITMIQYWYASLRCLQQRKIRLHAIFMTMFVISVSNAGVLRWFIRLMFYQSGCPAHTEKETTIIIQTIAQNFTAAMELGLVTMLYTTLTIEERQQSQAARYTFYWYVFHATLAWIGSACLKVPFSVSCAVNESSQSFPSEL